jgi:hypothetical protein
MKDRKNKFQLSMPGLLAVLAVCAFSSAATADQAVKETSVHSLFVLPSNPKEGRDPFFPDSLRPYESAVPKTHSVELTSLIFKGVSGPPDHRLVIINNHTFSVGDEGDVTTAQGRIHIRCVDIKANSVVLEASGQLVTLTFSTNP